MGRLTHYICTLGHAVISAHDLWDNKSDTPNSYKIPLKMMK